MINEQEINKLGSTTNVGKIKNKKKKLPCLIVTSILLVVIVAVVSYFSLLTNSGKRENIANETPGVLAFVSSAEDDSVGSLHYQCYGKEKQLVASNVQKEEYFLLPQTQLIVYLTNNKELFYKYPGEESVKIAEECSYLTDARYTKDEKKLFFEANGHYYCYTIGGEKELITNKPVLFPVAGENNILFSLHSSDSETFPTYMWSSGNGLEKLSDDVSHTHMDVVNNAYFVGTESELYIKLENMDGPAKLDVNLTSNLSGARQFLINDGYAAIYLARNNGKNILYLYMKDTEGFIIDEDVFSYYISEDSDYLYYVKADPPDTSGNGELYALRLPRINKNTYKNADKYAENLYKTDRSRIGSEVRLLMPKIETALDGKMMYTDENNNLFISLKQNESVKVASDVKEFTLFDDKFVFLTNSGNMYINNKPTNSKNVKENNVLIAKNVDEYYPSEYGQYIFYKEKDSNKLNLVSKDNSVQVFIEDITEYDFINYDDFVLYEKTMTEEDVIGCYASIENSCFIEFKEDETCNIYYNDEVDSGLWTFEPYDIASGDIDIDMDLLDEAEIEITPDDGKSILVDLDEEFELVSIEKEEFEKYVNIAVVAIEYFDDGIEISSEDTLYSEPNYNSNSDLKFTHSGEKTVKGYFISEDKSTIWLKLRINVDYESSYVWFPVSVVENDNV